MGRWDGLWWLLSGVLVFPDVLALEVDLGDLWTLAVRRIFSTVCFEVKQSPYKPLLQLLAKWLFFLIASHRSAIFIF